MDKPPQPNHRFPWSQISTNALVRFLLFFASGWIVVTLIEYFEYAIVVFSFAAILALLLNYPLQFLQRFVSRNIALGLTIAFSLIAIIVLVIGLGLTLATQLQQLATLLIEIFNTASNPLERLQSALVARNIPLDLSAIETQIRRAFIFGLNWVIGSLPALFQNYVTLIIVIVVAFFMLIDGEKLWRLLLKLVPPQQRDRVSIAVNSNFNGFIRGQLTISLLLSIATALVFVLFQVPFALLLAAIVGVFDLIPGIGATLGVSLVCLIILVQGGWIAALKVLIVCVILQQLQDNLLAPRVMQKSVHLNPVIVFLALLVGTRISGLLGIVLAVPIAGVIVSLLEIEAAQGD